MNKSVLSLSCFLLMLQLTVSGQDIINGDSLSDGQKQAIAAMLSSLSSRDSSLHVILDGDTIYEKKDSLSFSKAVLYKAMTENAVRKVCGVSFGTPFEFATYSFEKTFGSPVCLALNSILYKNVFYRGIVFDDISFAFYQDEDGSRYLNQAVFLKNARNKDDAVQIKDYIQKEMSWDYTSVHVLDDNLTVGGLPPCVSISKGDKEDSGTPAGMGYGFEIRILSPEANGYPFVVRVMYGPY